MIDQKRVEGNQMPKFGGLWIGIESFAEEKFSPTDMMLHSLIVHLSKEKRYCWASNKYLSRLLHTSITSIHDSINKLKKFSYITIEFNPKQNFRKLIPKLEHEMLERQSKNIGNFYSKLENEKSVPPHTDSVPPHTDSVPPHTDSVPLSKEVEHIENSREFDTDCSQVESGEEHLTVNQHSTYNKEICNYLFKRISLVEDLLTVKLPSIDMEGEEQSSVENGFRFCSANSEEGAPLAGRKHPTRENFKAMAQVPDVDHKHKETKYEAASEEARIIFDIWNDYGCGVHHNPNNLFARKMLYLLDNSILKRHRVDHIVNTIEKYSEMAKHPNRFGLQKKRISLEEFFVIPKFLKDRALKWGKPLPVPMFTHLYSGNGNGVEYSDEELKLYKLLKEAYIVWAIGAKDQRDYKLTRKQELDLLRAAPKLKKFISQGWLRTVDGADEQSYLSCVFDSLEKAFGKYQIRTGHLASDFTWNDLVPKFMAREHGTLEEVEEAANGRYN